MDGEHENTQCQPKMTSILYISSVSQGEFQSKLQAKGDALNENDVRAIEKALPSTRMQRNANDILFKDSIDVVVQAFEKAGDYYDEYTDPQTQVHQLTPTNRNQGKTPQLRQ